MSIHTILSQIEGQVFGHGGEVIEISIYRKDGKILSIPYHTVKKGLEVFAIRIVEELGKELIGEDEDQLLALLPKKVGRPSRVTLAKRKNIEEGRLYRIDIYERNMFRASQRTKLQKMKE